MHLLIRCLQNLVQAPLPFHDRPRQSPHDPWYSPVPMGRKNPLVTIVKEARAAQADWASVPAKQRAKYVRAMRNRIAARADGICELIMRTTGKTRVDAMSTEVLPLALAASWYARTAPRALRSRRIRGGHPFFFFKSSRLERVPWGVVGIISPWNYPFGIPLHDVMTALLAGNAVVLKVATQVEAVGEAVADVVKSSGLPEGLFHLVSMPGPEAGRAMIGAGVDKLCFTGSTEAGRDVMRTAAAGPVPVSLELGGSDAMIVLDDANLDRAAAGALWAGASNAGQSCAAVERVFVEERVYQGFRDRIARRVAALRVGPDRDFDVDVGPLSSPAQKRKVERIVTEALADGARVVASSGPSHGLFHPVLVLEPSDQSFTGRHEEIFGPLILLKKVRDEADAVAQANDSPYGLSASVWTRSNRRGRRVASQLAVGTVTLNDHMMSHGMAETPWGGCKGSGFSRTHGEAGLAEMSRLRVTVRDRMHRAPRAMWWYPHGRSVYEGLRAGLTALYGRGLVHRLSALIRFGATFLRSFSRRSPSA
jgi:acyl-CoA reductase-like NAD-dependent aldehyde dehydrogenase